jgi:SAM-dependent methyltransferase
MLEKYMKEEFLTGNNLVGDEFTQEEIEQWYREEEEAYCNLTGANSGKSYAYENINNFYGLKNILSKVKKNKDLNILCFGAAYGGEVRAIKKILDQFDSVKYRITVIDSSDEMLESIEKELNVFVKKAAMNGAIDLDTDSFDLITSFGVLHHIPNVSFVLSELTRVLKPRGFIILRDPISSMGDWSSKRKGTTINERGISANYFVKNFNRLNVKIVTKHYCFFSPVLKLFNFIKLGINSYIVIYIDFILSKLFSWNIYYFRNNIFKKFAPGSVYIIGQK